MGVGILAGLMWVPMSWIIRHPIGWWHAGVRTAAVRFFPDGSASGGRVVIESRPGEGTRVAVVLPTRALTTAR